ncbi:hypothetical protein ACQ4LE_006547 [Meloidogyne hapla]
MQNLAASANLDNLQLFSKALQESAQQSNDTSEHKQQQNPAISAADLQHYMLSHQQLYLSQLASNNNNNNFVSSPETTSINNCSSTISTTSIPTALFSTASQPSNTVISSSNCYLDTEIPSTTTNNNNNSFLLPSGHVEDMGSPKQQQQSRLPTTKTETTTTTSDQFSPNSNIENERLAAHLAQQKIVDQLLEAAGGGLLNSLENNLGGGHDELGQLMAQLISGSNNRNETEMQAAQLAQHLLASTTGQRSDVMSPSSSQQQISLLEQLQLLQMLGGSNNNNGLSELFSGQQFATSSGNEQQIFNGAKFGGITSSGGSPNKDNTYCEICNKNLCNRYFLKIHMAKKHGIGVIPERSPVKLGNSNFFGCPIPSTEQQQLPGRAQSATLLNRRESPPTNNSFNNKTQKQQQELSQFLCSSTPASVNNNNNLGNNNNSATNILQTSPNADSFSTDQQQQLMGQCLLQHLASQLGLSQSGERSNIIEQLIGAGLPLAELLQQQSAQRSTPSPDLNQIIHCSQCARQFPTQTALFHHQLTEHIGTNLEQQNNENNLAIRWAMNELNNNSGSGDGSGDAQQQQQFLNQLLGSNFSPNSANSSLLLPAFGALNNSEMDSAAMLAKLSAELASVSQASQGNASAGLLFQNGLSLGGQSGQIGSNKPPPPKRQYSSTSKNFCDLCNKEVCNKYFLRTHMLKMHNIVIDENKLVIANIDTSEKERRGEVKFRCEICLCSLTNRDQLRAHKREVHGMQAPLGASTSSTPSSTGKMPILAPLSSLGGVVEMTAADGQKHKICQSPTAIKRTTNLNNEEDEEGGMFPIKRPKIENDEDEEEEEKFRRRETGRGSDDVSDAMVLQLLNQWEEENGHGEVNEQTRSNNNKQENNVTTKEGEKHSHTSGSASPVSLHATTSGCNVLTNSLPEGFFRPPIDHQKSFLLQSFTIRTVSEGDSTSSSQSPLPEELVAYLPVRSMLLEPLKLTLELRPNPQNDSQIRDQHLENQKPILRKMENFELCDSYGAGGNEVVAPSSVP